jgi:DNA-binding NtrC family response regulator
LQELPPWHAACYPTMAMAMAMAMAMELTMATAMTPARRILLVLEDDTLTELLDETLRDAGHDITSVRDDGDVEALLEARRFDVVIVDLDTRARNGAALVARLRRGAPASTIVALLPCGGLPAAAPAPYHFAVEKPARLGALLAAIDGSRRTQ